MKAEGERERDGWDECDSAPAGEEKADIKHISKSRKGEEEGR